MGDRVSRTHDEVEIVAVGDELLLGDVVDTNGAWLGRRFAELGIRVARRTVVGDDADAIRDAVGAALERSNLVLCTGGLGPTHDDVTRPAVARLLGRRLVLDEAVLERIRSRFAAAGLRAPAMNRRQAQVPEGAVVLPNPVGTAPGLALDDGAGRAVVLLPGVPHELRALFDGRLAAWLRERGVQPRASIRRRVLRTTGIAESQLAERVEDVLDDLAPLSVAFLPTPTGVDIAITSWGDRSDGEADAALAAAEALVLERVGRFVYGRADDDLAAIVGRALADRGSTLAVAESCTGGLVAQRLTEHPGASAFLLSAVVAYADEAKSRILGVDPNTLAAYGAVSEETVRAMLEGVRRMAGTEAGIAVTGIAGPGGGSEAKPVGTVWLAAAVGARSTVRRFLFPGDRTEVRARSAQAVLDMLRHLLSPDGGERE